MKLRDYVDELEHEYAKQLKAPNYDEWVSFSVKINRPLRKYMDEIKNDKGKKEENQAAIYEFQFWNEFTSKLRGDPLTNRFVKRVAELRFEIKKVIS
ncbi:hypothetical protein ACWIE6_10855 [Paenibacillus taichungensis]